MGPGFKPSGPDPNPPDWLSGKTTSPGILPDEALLGPDPELEALFDSLATPKLSECLQDESVLLEAHRIVSQRNDAYGEPTDTAERVATAFSALTRRVIKPADVALIQILFKIVRSEHGYKRDNNVDLAGYTDIRERCFQKEFEE